MTDVSEVVTISTENVAAHRFSVRPEIVADGSPDQAIWQCLNLAEGAVTSGVWEGEACILDIAAYPNHEVFFVLSGLIRLEGTDGSIREVAPGMGAYVPKGWAGRWHTIGVTQKHYVNFMSLTDAD